MSPPNLPTRPFFVPLGALIDYVRAGNKFKPVLVEDVRSGELGALERVGVAGTEALWWAEEWQCAAELRWKCVVRAASVACLLLTPGPAVSNLGPN